MSQSRSKADYRRVMLALDKSYLHQPHSRRTSKIDPITPGVTAPVFNQPCRRGGNYNNQPLKIGETINGHR